MLRRIPPATWFVVGVIILVIVWVAPDLERACKLPSKGFDKFALSCVEFWFERYQTFLGAIVAIGAAGASIYFIDKQIAEARKQNAVAVRKEIIADIAEMSAEVGLTATLRNLAARSTNIARVITALPKNPTRELTVAQLIRVSRFAEETTVRSKTSCANAIAVISAKKPLLYGVSLERRENWVDWTMYLDGCFEDLSIDYDRWGSNLPCNATGDIDERINDLEGALKRWQIETVALCDQIDIEADSLRRRLQRCDQLLSDH